MTFANEDWKAKWQITLDAIGQDFSTGEIRWGADRIEPGLVRRYVEPLEIASPIHHDSDRARALGYENIVCPSTALLSFAVPAMWEPGDETLFHDPSRNSQPARTPINNQDPGPIPKTPGYFSTDMEIEFHRPVYVGERIGTNGRKLVDCVLKETSVGRGAFLTFESRIVSDRGDVVATIRSSAFAYEPNAVGKAG